MLSPTLAKNTSLLFAAFFKIDCRDLLTALHEAKIEFTS